MAILPADDSMMVGETIGGPTGVAAELAPDAYGPDAQPLTPLGTATGGDA